jgi:hypothetical protein
MSSSNSGDRRRRGGSVAGGNGGGGMRGQGYAGSGDRGRGPWRWAWAWKHAQYRPELNPQSSMPFLLVHWGLRSRVRLQVQTRGKGSDVLIRHTVHGLYSRLFLARRAFSFTCTTISASCTRCSVSTCARARSGCAGQPGSTQPGVGSSCGARVSWYVGGTCC